MKRRVPLGLILVATLQFVAPLILPPFMLRGLSWVSWALVLALFALIGYNLLRRHAWSRTATVFVQGFNVIVRLLVGIGHVLEGGKAGAPLDLWLLGTFVVSAALSVAILYYVDLPDVQVLMQ